MYFLSSDILISMEMIAYHTFAYFDFTLFVHISHLFILLWTQKCVCVFVVVLLVSKTSQNYLENSLNQFLKWCLLKCWGRKILAIYTVVVHILFSVSQTNCFYALHLIYTLLRNVTCKGQRVSWGAYFRTFAYYMCQFEWI